MVKRETLDPEVLAALLEGTLPPHERNEALERLARSPDDYEAFVEAASVLRDLEDDTGTAPVSPPPPPTVPPPVREIRPPRRWLPEAKLWLPLAAAVACVLVVQRVLLDDGDAPQTPVALLDRAPLVAAAGSGSLERSLGAGWDQPGWSVRRGGGQSLAEQRRGFRIGVRLAELDAALDAGDAEAVRDVAPDLVALIDQIGSNAGPLVRDYQRISDLATRQEPRREPDLEAESAAELTELFREAPWFGLGVWVEQARLATLAGRTELFDDPAAREALQALMSQVGRQLGPEASIARSLRDLDDRIGDGVTAGELEAIRSALTTLVREAGG